VVKVLETRNSEALSSGERIFALCSKLIGQVYNGGFDQYFFNGGTEDVFATARALECIGATKAGSLVQQAIAAAKLPEPPSADYNYYDKATESVRKELDALDQQFYRGCLDAQEIYPCLVQYLREHTDEFS
jgi:hypothetical protein